MSDDPVGGKPRNVNASPGSPDAESAATAAFGPGIGSTRIPASIAARISASPGSETVGVPASDTSATSSPARIRETRVGALRDSLWACRLVVGVRIACRASKWAVRRVSSAAITATPPRIRSARNVMSSRLPIGVATTNNVPDMSAPRVLYHWRIEQRLSSATSTSRA